MLNLVINPYDSPPVASDADNNARLKMPDRLSAFRDGFIRGLLWSFPVAVFGGLGIYGEFTIGVTNKFDPVTQTSTRAELSSGDVVYCIAATTVTVLSMIVIPWACAAGFVHMLRHGKIL